MGNDDDLAAFYASAGLTPEDTLIHTRITLLIGRVATFWNYAELELQHLMVSYLGLKGHVGWLIIQNMGNITRCNILRAAAREYEKSEEAKEHIFHAISLFEICRENRNALLHAICSIDDGRLSILRTHKGIGDHLHYIQTNWTVLEKVPESISILEAYLNNLWNYFSRRPSRRRALPDKPALPDKLTLILAGRKADQSQPRSSRG